MGTLRCMLRSKNRIPVALTRMLIPLTALTLVTACGASVPQEVLDPTDSSATADLTTGTPQSFASTGQPEQLTVPDGATHAHVDASGAGGGTGGSMADGAGRGGAISADLAVSAGQVLTIGVGGAGGAPKNGQAPGSGGWGLTADAAGGSGGHSRGSSVVYHDGPGGGGATVLQVDGVDTIIAAGGGGTGGEGSDGGDAGFPNGNPSVMDTPGGATTPSKTNYDATGRSIGSGIGDGGGGGGGGYAKGQGGDAGEWGGIGGGGGASWYDTTVGVTNFKTGAGSSGNGSMTITFS